MAVRSILKVLTFDVFSKLLMGAFSFLLIHFMSAQEYGLYIFLWSLVLIFTETLNSIFNRLYLLMPDTGGVRAIKAFFTLQVFLGLAVALLALPWHRALGHLNLLLAFFVLLNCFWETLRTSVQRTLRFSLYAGMDVLKGLLTIGGLAATIFFLPYLQPAHIFAVQIMAILAVSAIFGLRYLNIGGIFDLASAGDLMRRMLQDPYRWLIGFIFLLAVFMRVDILMLKMMTGEAGVATYGSAYQYYSFLILILMAIHNVFLPTMMSMDQAAIRNLFLDLKRVTFPAILLIACLIVMTPGLIPLIDRGKYPAAVPVFQVLALSSVVSLLFSPYMMVLIKHMDFVFLFWFMLLGIILAVVGDFWCIRKFGVVGAAYATCICYAFVNVSFFIRAKRIWAAL